ncbi:MarR family transcriptional regulator, partial [Microbacteriaceae bacterium K1510]|nr:MarR family transcriptional regulator [Microbacteriaceae bacterium K1510]
EMTERFPDVDTSSLETLLLFMRTSRDIHSEMSGRLSRHGLSQGKFIILMLLFRSTGNHLTPSELAARAGVTRGTITGLLDGLQRDGLIQRGTTAADRRMVTIQLTMAGEQVLNQLLPGYFTRTSELLSELDHSERQILVTLLNKMKTGLEQIK